MSKNHPKLKSGKWNHHLNQTNLHDLGVSKNLSFRRRYMTLGVFGEGVPLKGYRSTNQKGWRNRTPRLRTELTQRNNGNSNLVGGFNPSEKYARQNGFIFPNFRGEKIIKSLSCDHLAIHPGSLPGWNRTHGFFKPGDRFETSKKIEIGLFLLLGFGPGALVDRWPF